MSQHYIQARKYRIVVGWDPPLQHFFATVWSKEVPAAVEFTTLSLPGGGVRTEKHLADVLRNYIDLSEEILEVLEEDRLLNRGNVVRYWDSHTRKTADERA